MSTEIIEVSEYPMRFRSQIFQNTNSLYNNEFVALSKYSECHKIFVTLARFEKN